MAQLTVPKTVTRKQVPATQIQGAGTNLEETTVEPVLKTMPVDNVMNVNLGTLVIQPAKVCS